MTKRPLEQQAPLTTRVKTSANDRPPWPKRKVAILMGYAGHGYHGMQLNPGVPTIEAALWEALVAEGVVSPDNAVDVKKVGWMRSCRTDKGVHAAGQVVSLKMLLKGYEEKDNDDNNEEGEAGGSKRSKAEENEGGKELAKMEPEKEEVEKSEQRVLDQITVGLNARLPAQIRIFGIRRTVGSFHAKERTDSRYYEYLLPTYVLTPLPDPALYFDAQPRTAEDKAKDKEQKRENERKTAIDEDDANEAIEEESVPVFALSEGERKEIVAFRVSPDELTRLREFMARYVGTHSYHNFTLGMAHGNASARRTIYSLSVSDPFVQEGLEWVRIRLHGQSFMLHQIRKMVGLAVMAQRLGLHPRLVSYCFGPVRVNIPRAPALGLLLDQPLFTAYNRFHGDTYPPIDFEEFASEREALKQTHIFPRIFGEEAQAHPFAAWLRCNDDYAGEFTTFLNRDFLN